MIREINVDKFNGKYQQYVYRGQSYTVRRYEMQIERGG